MLLVQIMHNSVIQQLQIHSWTDKHVFLLVPFKTLPPPQLPCICNNPSTADNHESESKLLLAAT